MAKTGSALGYGILGLLSGLGQGLLQHQQLQRENIKEKTKREQDIADREDEQAARAEQTDKTIAAENKRTEAQAKSDAERAKEEARHNKAVEDANAKNTELETRLANAQQDYQNRVNLLTLQNNSLQAQLEIIRMTNGKDPASEARKFIAETYHKLIQQTIYQGPRNADNLKQAMDAANIQAFQQYHTTGSDILDQQIIDAVNKQAADQTGNKGAATQPKQATEKNFESTPSGLGQGINKLLGIFNPFPDYVNQPAQGGDLADVLKGVAGVPPKKKPYGPMPLRTVK